MNIDNDMHPLFNPATLPLPESYAARYWELLRRNKEFIKVSTNFAKSANFRNNHHIINHWSGCCLYWVIKPTSLRKVDKENIELKFWRPDLLAKGKTQKPLAVDQEWPNTNIKFRSALVNVIDKKRTSTQIDLSLSVIKEFDKTNVTERLINLDTLNQKYFVVGIPRGHYNQKELKRLLNEASDLYRAEYPLPPDKRKNSYLGSREEWDAFLLVESEGDLNSACIERLKNKVREKEGRNLKPGEAETAHAKFRDSITQQKKRIDQLIQCIYSRTITDGEIQWDPEKLGVKYYFGKKSGPFHSSNHTFLKYLVST